MKISVASLSLLLATTLAEESCRLYLGPSSTSTDMEPKFGLYAGVTFEQGETIGSPEIGVPLVDFSESWNREDPLSDTVIEFLEGFMWTSDFAGSKFEGNHTTTMAIPGIGILAQYHSGTYNADWNQASVLLREPMEGVFGKGKSNPSRGAITPYHNFTMQATQRIVKGMEIFANFGDVWDGNKTANIYGDKMSRQDYIDADKILDKILAFMDKYKDEMSGEQKDQVLDFILSKILGTALGTSAQSIRSLIPAHPGKLQTVKDMGGTFAYRNPDLVRSQRWLDKHASCIDNLEVKASTIPEAGRGAFAKRDFKKGQVVSHVPMVHVVNENIATMYELDVKTGKDGETKIKYNKKKPIGRQLLLNYCFSHPESSMLLFPIASGVSQINHASPEEANARLTWSKHKDFGNVNELHDMTPTELTEYQHVSIVMELYALRDIKEGEEILIDYGREWQNAWEKHAEYFEGASTGAWPLRAEDMNAEQAETKQPFRTFAELQYNPYPPGIMTACFIQTKEQQDGKPRTTKEGVEIFPWDGPRKLDEHMGNMLLHCDVVDRVQKEGREPSYTVMAYQQGGGMQVTGVPPSAIRYMDRPYSGDVHWQGAFRHWIGIPDVIFPQAWRDYQGTLVDSDWTEEDMAAMMGMGGGEEEEDEDEDDEDYDEEYDEDDEEEYEDEDEL